MRVVMPFLLPHILMSSLFAQQQGVFFERFCGAVDAAGASQKLSEFWSEVVSRRDPRIANHPMCRRAGWQRFAIPIMIHGDAVPVVAVGKAGTKSLDCLSFQGLLARGGSLEAKSLMFSIFEDSKLLSGETMEVVWRILVHAFESAYLGTHPSHPHDSADPYDPLSSEGRIAGTPLCSIALPFFLSSGASKVIWCGTPRSFICQTSMQTSSALIVHATRRLGSLVLIGQRILVLTRTGWAHCTRRRSGGLLLQIAICYFKPLPS